MARTGDYTVTFVSPLQHASLSTGEMLKQSTGIPMIAKSASLRLWVDGRDQLAKGGMSAQKGKPGGGGTVVNGVSYVGCTTTQINTGGQRRRVGAQLHGESQGLPRRQHPGSALHHLVRRLHRSRAIRTVASTSSTSTTPSTRAPDRSRSTAAATQNYYAYVYPTRPYEIFVCRRLLDRAADRAPTPRRGTLIHEMSHFNVVAGTDDYVYGQTGAKSLAISNPAEALDNADSHEYFAENNPSRTDPSRQQKPGRWAGFFFVRRRPGVIPSGPRPPAGPSGPARRRRRPAGLPSGS